MNILVNTFKGNIVYRPDSGKESEKRDLYFAKYSQQLSYSPVVFLRVSKSGKQVQEKFASRYYDAFSYGILIYVDSLNDGSDEGLAAASCVNSSSLLPSPMFNADILGEENYFRIYKNGKEIFNSSALDASKAYAQQDTLNQLVVNASKFASLRIGDILCLELAERKPLANASEKQFEIVGMFSEQEIIKHKVLFEID